MQALESVSCFRPCLKQNGSESCSAFGHFGTGQSKRKEKKKTKKKKMNGDSQGRDQSIETPGDIVPLCHHQEDLRDGESESDLTRVSRGLDWCQIQARF